ncbi:MAG TPA: hypothetical protein VKY85_21580 [Candidatus Angelobacter sp.]|nr:hypothetical protein [Candidatus Angelobacter sp.]
MKRIIIFITLGIIGCVCAAQTPQSAVSPQPAFSIALSPPAGPISAASSIDVKITVQNISGKPISWVADFGDTAYKAFHFSLKKDGHEVETTFFHRKITGKHRSGDPAEVSGGSAIVSSLAPEESVVQTVDLKHLYQITEPGSYTLEVSRYDDESSTMVRSTLALTIGP